MGSYLVTIICCLLISFLAECSIVRVDPQKGNDENCSTEGIPCCTLERAFNITKLINVTVQISGNVELRNSCIEIKYASNISINGLEGTTNIECSGNSGFVVKDVRNFTVSNLSFNGCGYSRNDSITYRAAVSIESSSDIKIMHTSITHSLSTGIVFKNCRDVIALQKVNISFNNNTCCFPAGMSIEVQ